MPTGIRSCGCPSRKCWCGDRQDSELFPAAIPKSVRRKRSPRLNDRNKVDFKASEPISDSKENSKSDNSKSEDKQVLESGSCNCGESNCSCDERTGSFQQELREFAVDPTLVADKTPSPQIQEPYPELEDVKVAPLAPFEALPGGGPRSCGCPKRKCRCGVGGRIKASRSVESIHPMVREKLGLPKKECGIKQENGKLEIGGAIASPSDETVNKALVPEGNALKMDPGKSSPEEEKLAGDREAQEGFKEKNASGKKRKGPGTGRRVCGCPARMCKCAQKRKLEQNMKDPAKYQEEIREKKKLCSLLITKVDEAQREVISLRAQLASERTGRKSAEEKIRQLEAMAGARN